jgi:hypothetical protein
MQCDEAKQEAIQAWNLDAKLEFSSEELEPEKLLNSLERGLANFLALVLSLSMTWLSSSMTS